jgi:hypothetical protein
MLITVWLHLVLYFSTEYHNSRQNIVILFREYLVDIRSEAWLNLFLECINGKLFAVQYSRKICSNGLKRGLPLPLPLPPFGGAL